MADQDANIYWIRMKPTFRNEKSRKQYSRPKFNPREHTIASSYTDT